MSEMMPDPTQIKGEGPLAGRVSNRPSDEELAAQEAEWRAEAMQAMETLVAGGMEENQARGMLGLEPNFTPEDDPREWVTYYEPPEEDDDDIEELEQDARELEKLTGQFARMFRNDPAEAPQAIAKMFLATGRGEAPQGSGDQAPPGPITCDLCGALVADAEKHIRYAHPEFAADMVNSTTGDLILPPTDWEEEEYHDNKEETDGDQPSDHRPLERDAIHEAVDIEAQAESD